MNQYFISLLRRERNIEIKAAAQELEMQVNNLYLVESGSRTLSDEKLSKLAYLYNCSKTWFTGTPGLTTTQDIIFYLKRLYVLGKGQFKVQYNQSHTRLLAKFTEIDKFLKEWFDIKKKLAANEISEAQYLDWVYKHAGSDKQTEVNDKLWEIRNRKELLEPGVTMRLASRMKRPFVYYQQIENGFIIPKEEDKIAIAETFGVTPEFLFDRFGFTNLFDVHMFLLTVDQLFHIITLGEDSQVRFNDHSIELFFERILDLEEQFQSGKITKRQYDIEWDKL